MKNKKFMAIALCIAIVASSFGGSLIGYAKDNKIENGKLEVQKNTNFDDGALSELPSQNIIKLEPEIKKHEDMPSNKIIVNSEGGEEILYKGTESTLDPSEEDMYDIGKKEINDMMSKGYSIEDIFEADRISNELYIEPEVLLEEKEASNKSLNQIKNEMIDESKEKAMEELKTKYKSEYKDLMNKKLGETDIYNLLAYADINNIPVSDELVKEYKNKGDKLFKEKVEENSEKAISKETKRKYQLSGTDTEELSEDLIAKFELLSEKTGKSVEELTESYIKNKKNNK